jgi:phosphopantothenoylcysteine decarboxylase/phosphopantothenate--cysteine ligase
MRTAVHDCFVRKGADVYISAAAISDFAPRKIDGKIPSGKLVHIDLEPLPKLLEEVVKKYSPRTIAFKLGRDQDKIADAMISGGGIEMVLINAPETMGSESGEYVIVTRGDKFPVSGTKEEIAVAIWEKLLQ